MALVMKELMDLFDAESIEYQNAGNYDGKFVFDNATSLVNNCHQKSPAEINNFLMNAFTQNIQRNDLNDNEKLAWEDALLLLEIYFDK